MRFEWPWALLSLALLPWLLWRLRTRRRIAVPFPGWYGAGQMPRSLRQRFIHLPDGLRLFALVLLIVAIAGPIRKARIQRRISNSIGIQVLVDRSSSMAGSDMFYAGRPQTRLDAVKRVSEDFIFGNGGDLKGRPSDMVGLIAFAADPVTLCPLTLTHEQLLPALKSLRVVEGNDDGTAIGDAIALAAARFELLEGRQRLKSKVIILITDGENNLGAHAPLEAAELARKWGVRIYAIGIRPAWGHGDYETDVSHQLNAISAATSGISRIVTDVDGLRAVYTDIDRLERSDVSAVRLSHGNEASAALAFAALALLALETSLRETWLRRVP
jgi:Ca-activated chloride channel family protein